MVVKKSFFVKWKILKNHYGANGTFVLSENISGIYCVNTFFLVFLIQNFKPSSMCILRIINTDQIVPLSVSSLLQSKMYCFLAFAFPKYSDPDTITPYNTS